MITGDLARRAEALVREREPFVLATVVRAVSPTSVRPGDVALVLGDGTVDGFVGGTCTKTSLQVHAARALASGDSVLLRLVPGVVEDGEDAPDEGVVVEHNPCLSGGMLELFLEPRLPAARVVVGGDTPIAHALVDVARAAGYEVWSGGAGEVEPRASDAALVVASHGTDEEIALRRGLEAGVPYVALVASPVRGAAVKESLDVDDEQRDAVHTPAGLDIGAHAPGEIAVAILAQVVAEGAAGAAVPQASVGAAREAAPPLSADATREAEDAAPSSPAPRRPAPPVVAVDPVCGMEVLATDASIHLDVDGERFWFCREGCRDHYAAQRAADGA